MGFVIGEAAAGYFLNSAEGAAFSSHGRKVVDQIPE
jgi:hypothetical protein